MLCPSCPPCYQNDQNDQNGIKDKRFATILKSQSKYVRFQSSTFKTVKKIDKKMPETFNPIKIWGNFLTGPRDQGKCGACWAMSTSKTLTDRYALLSQGSFNVILSGYVMVMCQGTVLPSIPSDEKILKDINLEAHTSGACNGNSLYTAMDFMYSVGCISNKCVNTGLFDKYAIPDITTLENPEDVPMCQSILGPNYNQCLDRESAPRFYRIIAGYQIDKDIEAIKQDIYKWGPVTSGFEIYDDFIDEYDGKSIYMGPKKGSKSQGGHAIEICGWGRENGVDFWWICNSWGVDWGLGGYFKMKMNIPECQLEENVIGFIPDFPSFNISMIPGKISMSPDLIALRLWMDIDSISGYKKDDIESIKNGKLKGDIKPIFSSKVPDMNNTWLGEITDLHQDLYYSAYGYSKVDDNTIYKLAKNIMIIIGCYYIGKYINIKMK